ncbi:MAG: DNA-processing protein DprA, partial [Eubacteriales bacterium]
MAEDKRMYYLWLSLVFGPASHLAVKLLDIVGSPDKIFEEKLKNLHPNDHLTEKELEQAKTLLKSHPFSEAEQMLNQCSSMDVDILTPDSVAYPDALRYLPDRPLALYLRGTLPDCNHNMTTTVVGTR